MSGPRDGHRDAGCVFVCCVLFVAVITILLTILLAFWVRVSCVLHQGRDWLRASACVLTNLGAKTASWARWVALRT